MSYSYRFIVLTSLALGSALVGCGGDSGAECGAGTVDMDGVCIPTEMICAPPTTFNPETRRCEGMPDTLACGPGTEQVGDECVPTDSGPECGVGTSLMGGDCVVDGSVVCTGNTEFDMETGTCVLTDELCEEGTVFLLESGTCVPTDETLEDMADVTELAEPNDPAFNEEGMPQVVEIPDSGPVSIYGCIEPEDFDDDRVIDGDLDFFQISVDGPTVLNVNVDGIRGLSAAAAFIPLADTPLSEAGWQRLVLDLSGDDAQGEVYLPGAGDYFFAAADARQLLFGEPAGDTDTCYFIQLEVGDLPEFEAIEPGTPVTGDFDALRGFELTSTEGQLLFTNLQELDADGEPTDVGGIISSFVVTADGTFNATSSDPGDGSGNSGGVVLDLGADETVRFVIDHVYNLSFDTVDFSFDVTDAQTQPIPEDGDLTFTYTEDEDGLSVLNWGYFTAEAGDIVHITMDSADTLAGDDGTVGPIVFGPDGTGGVLCGSPCSSVDEYFQVGATGTHYIQLFSDDRAVDETFDVTFTRESVTPTELTIGTAESVDLTSDELAFFSADLMAAEWVDFAISALTGTITDADVTFYPLGEFGVLGLSLAEEDSDTAGEDAPFERIYGAMGPSALIVIGDADAHDEDETFDFTIADVPFTDLGTVDATTDATADDEALAADGVARFIVRDDTPGEALTVSVTGDDPIDPVIDVLEIPTAVSDETIDETGAGEAEEIVRGVGIDGLILAFVVTDGAGAAGTFDVLVSAEPPPYTFAEDSGIGYVDVCTLGEEPELNGGSDDGVLMTTVDLTAGTPFNFVYMGETVTELDVSTNGWLAFAQIPRAGFRDTYLTSPGTETQNAVAPQAFDFTEVTVCLYQDADTYTVQWTGVTFGSGKTAQMQAVLHSGSNTIDFVYGPDHDASIVEDPAGFHPTTAFTALQRGSDGIVVPGPAPVPGESVTWTPVP